jgi:hypothetical protein
MTVANFRDLCAYDAKVEEWADRIGRWLPYRREAFRVRPRKVLKVPLRRVDKKRL